MPDDERSLKDWTEDTTRKLIWDRRYDAKVAQRYYDLRACQYHWRDRALKLLTLAAVIGIAVAAQNGWMLAVQISSVITAACTVLGLAMEWAHDREVFLTAGKRQGALEEDWDALWIDLEFRRIDFEKALETCMVLIHRGNQIAHPTGADSIPSRIMDKADRLARAQVSNENAEQRQPEPTATAE